LKRVNNKTSYMYQTNYILIKNNNNYSLYYIINGLRFNRDINMI
jgi:hypothetical protein